MAMSQLRYQGIQYVPNPEAVKKTEAYQRFAASEETGELCTTDEEYEADFESEDSEVSSTATLGSYLEMSSSSNRLTREERVLMEIIKLEGVPYRYGGNTRKGIDCSAFTLTVFSNALNIQLNRSARDQFKQGDSGVLKRDELQFGDLVFFDSRRRVRPGHVGLYLGHGLFAHASTKYGVVVQSLDAPNYKRSFMGGKRFDGLFDESRNPLNQHPDYTHSVSSLAQ